MRPCDSAEYQPDYDPEQVMADWQRFITESGTGYNPHQRSYVIYHARFNAYRRRLGRMYPLMVGTVKRLYEQGNL